MTEYLKDIETLEKYAELEGTEIGEYCLNLIRVAEYPSYMSDEFKAAVTKEILLQLNMFAENTEIVTEEEIIKRTSQRLNWL